MSLLSPLKSFLGVPALYQGFQNAVGKRKLLTAIVAELGPLSPDTRVLDVGCGTGDICGYLPPVRYVGVDLSDRYIAAARRAHGDRGEFLVLSADGLAGLKEQAFDVVLAIGLVHHLTDAQVRQMITDVTRLIGANGRAMFVDPVFVPGQHPLAAWMIQQDRGRFVRNEAAYHALSAEGFSNWRGTVRHDLLRIPYSHLIQHCRN